MSTADDERTGLPKEAVTDENIKKIDFKTFICLQISEVEKIGEKIGHE